MTINTNSIKEICGKSDTVVVFGFGKYDYLKVCDEINKLPDIKAFNSDTWTLAESDWGGMPDCFRFCKNIITDLVLQNYKRSLEGKPLIPLIFCVGDDKSMYKLDEIATKDEDINEWVTNSELRRCFKLFTKFNKAIQKMTEDTIKFVKLSKNAKGQLELQQIVPFWYANEWGEIWNDRKANPQKKAKQTSKTFSVGKQIGRTFK